MRETGRCLEFPFQRREASVEWRGSMLPSVCEATDPLLLKDSWCDFCPSLGPWDFRASLASPVLLARWYRHSRRQVCSPNSCPDVEEVWMLNNRAVIGNWFVHLPAVWVKVSRWCLASYLLSRITSFFFFSLSFCVSPSPSTAPAAARKRGGGWCLLLPLRAVQLLDQGQAQPDPACTLHEAPTQWEPSEASAPAEGPARGGGGPQLHLHHPQMPYFRYR